MAGVWVDKPPLSAEMVTGGVYMARPGCWEELLGDRPVSVGAHCAGRTPANGHLGLKVVFHKSCFRRR
ncbi:hypothetical protein EYF80_000046 [Liparis tanakae]|uniref:Uncharacterized protein n=1 Tax=Liparis tanakae TaxID=230148 RepID=A0A4Z2JI06_9TELE|nr:hypothetical protein EYF80_000046 [Liparis tanakae]